MTWENTTHGCVETSVGVDGEASVTVVGTDDAGNVGDGLVGSWVLDRVAPVVSAARVLGCVELDGARVCNGVDGAVLESGCDDGSLAIVNYHRY